jgi:hypothetical protein
VCLVQVKPASIYNGQGRWRSGAAAKQLEVGAEPFGRKSRFGRTPRFGRTEGCTASAAKGQDCTLEAVPWFGRTHVFARTGLGPVLHRLELAHVLGQLLGSVGRSVHALGWAGGLLVDFGVFVRLSLGPG